MKKIIICGDTSGFYSHSIHRHELFSNTEEIKYVEMVGFDLPNRTVVIKLEEFDVSEDNSYLFLLSYNDIDSRDTAVDEEILKELSRGKIKLVIDRGGELINEFDIDKLGYMDTSNIRQNIRKLDIDIVFISMNLGKKLFEKRWAEANSGKSTIYREVRVMEVGFDQQLVECAWNVPKVLDDVEDFYFKDLSEYKKTHRFICLNATFSSQRLLIISKILDGELDKKSMISMVNKTNVSDDKMLLNLKTFSKSIDEKSISRTISKLPIIFDMTTEEFETSIRFVNPMLVDEDYILNLKKSYFSLVTEADINPFFKNNPCKITEKIYKAISFHPFIIIGGCGILKYIRSLGFKTFPEMFDESYDDIEDNYERIDFIYKEVKKLCDMDDEELHKIYVSIIPKIRHNCKILHNIDTGKILIKLFNDVNKEFNK
jgi:hypothetical protein